VPRVTEYVRQRVGQLSVEVQGAQNSSSSPVLPEMKERVKGNFEPRERSMDSSTASFVLCERPKEKATLKRAVVNLSFGLSAAANAGVVGSTGGRGIPE